MNARTRAAAAAAALVLLPAAGCTQATTGHAGPRMPAADSVAGLPAADGPTGLRPGAPAPATPVDGAAGGPVDTVATAAVDDLGRYWAGAFPAAFHRPWTPVARAVSWDSSSTAPGPGFCGAPTTGIANAGFCRSHNEIGWDRGPLLTGLSEKYGEMAPVVVLAHEFGHVVQYQTGMNATQAPTIVLEQQADCYAGVFLRHVAEGSGQHFTMNTTDGLGSALAVLVGIRDSPDPDVFAGAQHGSAFERVTAFQEGFGGDPLACARIDAAEVDARSGAAPLDALGAGGGAPAAVDAPALQALSASLGSWLPLARPPRIVTDDPAAGCAHAAGPATYCPGTGDIGVDLPALAADPGGFAAWTVVASRYALAAEDADGAGVTGTAAGLRAGCLAGAWAASVAARPDGPVRMRAGDLDGAVMELLADGRIASDADGRTAASSFARVDAFRRGFTGGADPCHRLYR